MRKRTWAALALLGGAVVIGCASKHASRAKPAEATVAIKATVVPRGVDPVARGKYLVTVIGCNDCHTPFKMTPTGPAPDMARMLSGHPAELKITSLPKHDGPWVWSGVGTNTAFAGPWGVSFACNLTPDKISGMGAVWDEARFIKAMRTGKHFGEARPILPPMPWQGLGQASDEDLKAIWAYLQSIPAIHNEVPSAIPPRGAGALQ